MYLPDNNEQKSNLVAYVYLPSYQKKNQVTSILYYTTIGLLVSNARF